jgi:DNA replication protein DnaC
VCQCVLNRRAESIIRKTVPEIFLKAPRLKDITPYEKLYSDLSRQVAIIEFIKESPLDAFFFLGPSGTGKSYLMWALYKEALYAGRQAKFTSCRDLVNSLRKDELGRSGDVDHNLVTVSDLKKSYFGPFHLFIDEWGKAPESEYVYNQLFSIADYCCSNPSNVVLNITTNYNEKDFSDVYGDAMLRRIKESTCTIKFGDGK